MNPITSDFVEKLIRAYNPQISQQDVAEMTKSVMKEFEIELYDKVRSLTKERKVGGFLVCVK